MSNLDEEMANKLQGQAVIEFVDMMIGAMESGFTDINKITLAQIYQVARHHVKDNYGKDTPSIAEKWGDERARACGVKI